LQEFLGEPNTKQQGTLSLSELLFKSCFDARTHLPDNDTLAHGVGYYYRLFKFIKYIQIKSVSTKQLPGQTDD